LTRGYPRPVLSLALAALIATSSPITDEPKTIPAAFTARSYARGAPARLVVWSAPRGLSIQLFHAGPEKTRSLHNDVMRGVPVTKRTSAHVVEGAVSVRTPFGASGLYFAKLTAPDGKVGYAPFVLRPRVLGRVRVLVVLPTNTWEAYNLRDVDGNGVGDTWYANSSIPSVDLTRPFLDRGVPPHFRAYDQGFLRWFAQTHRRADVISDDDLERLSGERLAKLYDLVVFPGHEEYVTPHVYRAIERFRDLGGNLAFLSANNFFYVVDRRGNRIFRTGRYRDIGMDSARITGARYVGWFEGTYPTRPYAVTGAKLAPWLFAGTGLHDGSTFGNYGIEIDARGLGSPRRPR
jgi:N,N-dimethylformamidase beta subunit-like, C-terminal